ncbi:unnamed protein product, partial [Mesorhabditis spiculigera]
MRRHRVFVIFHLLLSIFVVRSVQQSNITYEDLPAEYRLLMSEDVFNSVVLTSSELPIIQHIFEEYDRPVPHENITVMLKESAPIFHDKIQGFLEKIDFQFELLRLQYPNESQQFTWIDRRMTNFLVNEAIDFFAFTPLIDVHMNEQISKLLPNVEQAIGNLSTEFEAILETLSDSMLKLQLEVVSEVEKESEIDGDYAAVNKRLTEDVYDMVPESLENINRVLPYAMINAMHELHLSQMEKIWQIYGNISNGYDYYKGLNLPDFQSFDADFLGWTVRQYLGKSLDALIAHKKFSIVKDLDDLDPIALDSVLNSTNFSDRLDAIHEELDYILNNRLKFLLLCAIGSIPPQEHHYVRRLVAHYLPGEKLLTKVAELHANAPYLSGKVIFVAERVQAMVRWYCRKQPLTCTNLNKTAEFVTSYYIRGMLRIFDLLPDAEIDGLKKVQISMKLEKYRYIMESLEKELPSLYTAIVRVHENIEKKLGAMNFLGTQEFVRKIEMDTMRVLILISLGKDDDLEDFREYARSWRRGFTSMGRKARAEIAAALPDFAKALTIAA